VTGIPTLQNLPRTAAARAHAVSVYTVDDRHEVVVEVIDQHQTVLARTVIESEASRETVVDALLTDSYLDRYSGFTIDPLGGRRRLTALAGLRLTLDPAPYRPRGRGAMLAG